MKKMNICLFLISSCWGGAENVVYHLAKYLGEKNQSVSIILNDEIYPFFKDLSNIRLYNIGQLFNFGSFSEKKDVCIKKNSTQNVIFKAIIHFVLIPFLKFRMYYKKKKEVIKLIADLNPDVIHFHNPIVLEFYSFIYKDIPSKKIYTGHAKDYAIPFLNIPLIKKVQIRKIMESFDGITAVSKYVKDSLLAIHFNDGENIRVIYNGLPNDISHVNNTKKDLPYEFNIGFMGGTKKEKGGDIVIKSMGFLKEELVNAHLFITKPIPMDHAYRKLIHELELQDNVTLLGFLEKQEYFSWLRTMDVIVMPTKEEGFPMLYLEAMAMGIPIITTPFGGTKELIKNNRNGLYITRDPRDIAEKISYLYYHPEIRENLGTNNVEDVKKFQWITLVDQYVEFYEYVINT